MNSTWIATVLGMLVVTYVVRLAPFVVRRMDALPPRLRRALTYVPPAALGALIVPDAFLSIDPVIAVGALGVSVVAYRFRPGIIVPVTAAVAVAAAVLWSGIVS